MQRPGQASTMAKSEWRTGTAATDSALRAFPEVTWAVMCGTVSSGLFRWSSAISLNVITTWFIAVVALGVVFAHWAALRGVASQVAGELGAPTGVVAVPYALPGSPGQRLTAWIGSYRAQWRDSVWPNLGRHLLIALLGMGLALVMAIRLGPEPLRVLGAGLVLALVFTGLAPQGGRSLPIWLRGLQVSLGWALGYVSLGPCRWPSLGLAALVGLGVYARERLQVSGSILAAGLAGIVWCSFVVALLMGQQPILAAIVAVAALAEKMSNTGSSRGKGVSLARTAGWFTSMLILGLAVGYWG